MISITSLVHESFTTAAIVPWYRSWNLYRGGFLHAVCMTCQTKTIESEHTKQPTQIISFQLLDSILFSISLGEF